MPQADRAAGPQSTELVSSRTGIPSLVYDSQPSASHPVPWGAAEIIKVVQVVLGGRQASAAQTHVQPGWALGTKL